MDEKIQCSRCPETFYPEFGGECIECGRLLCSSHIYYVEPFRKIRHKDFPTEEVCIEKRNTIEKICLPCMKKTGKMDSRQRVICNGHGRYKAVELKGREGVLLDDNGGPGDYRILLNFYEEVSLYCDEFDLLENGIVIKLWWTKRNRDSGNL